MGGLHIGQALVCIGQLLTGTGMEESSFYSAGYSCCLQNMHLALIGSDDKAMFDHWVLTHTGPMFDYW